MDDQSKPTRRDVLKRVGVATGVIAASAALGRVVWDHGGYGVEAAAGQRQVRDFRDPEVLKDKRFAELAVAHADGATPEQLVT